GAGVGGAGQIAQVGPRVCSEGASKIEFAIAEVKEPCSFVFVTFVIPIPSTAPAGCGGVPGATGGINEVGDEFAKSGSGRGRFLALSIAEGDDAGARERSGVGKAVEEIRGFPFALESG